MAQGGDDGGVSVNVVGSGFVSHSTVTEEAVTTRYCYSGGALTDIRHPDYTMHFTYDAVGPATVTYNGTAYYYLRNAQGDVTGLVNAAGQKVVTYAYDAWGNPLTATGSMAATLGEDNPLRYRGYVYDTETGLYYLKSRYYNPDRGRFINADGYVSTGQGVLGNNMFAYCNNNPSNMADSAGTYPYRTHAVYMADSGSGGGGVGGVVILGALLVWVGTSWIANRVSTLLQNASAGAAVNAAKAPSISIPKGKEKEKDIAVPLQLPPSTAIYRYGGANPGNLTPKAKDKYTGLSFSTVPMPGAAMTTIGALNATGLVYAVRDGVTHVSVRPVGGTMDDWINAGPGSVWTQAVKSVVIKWNGES